MAIVAGLAIVGVYFGSWFINFMLLLAAAATREPIAELLAQIVGQIIGVAIGCYFQASGTYLGLNWARRGRVNIADLFAASKWFLKSVGFTILIYIAIFAVCIDLEG